MVKDTCEAGELTLAGTNQYVIQRAYFRISRRLRLGMVGGGSDSVIGRTHLIAARVDGFYELAAGVLSVNPEIARASARAELIVEDRAYTDYSVMAEREANRSAGIDVVTIATPPQLHLPVAREFLRRGIHVICEKPFTKDLQEAHELRKLASESGRLLCFALTANAMQGEREKCLAVGMNDYLSKPVRTADLQTVLERWKLGQKWGKAPSAG